MPHLLEKLKRPKEENLRCDFHSHIYTNYREEANKWFFEPGNRDLKWLVETCLRKEISCLGIANFLDQNYEFWTKEEQIKKLPYNWKVYQDNRITYIETEEKRQLYLIKSEEIPTDKGHVLLVGGVAGKNIKARSLEEVLDSAENLGLIKIADHPYTRFPGFKGIGKYLEEYKEKIDALEWNANLYLGNRRLRKTNKNVIANSHSHKPKDIGNAYTIFPCCSLNFENGEKFIDSLKKNIRERNFVVKKGHNPLTSIVHHFFMNLLYHILIKLGWKKLIE